MNKDYTLRELLDLNEYGFYTHMPDSVVKRNELGYFLKNKVIETYSYITPTLEGEKNFELFLSYAFNFFSSGNEYFILKHPLDEYYQRNSKILRTKGFISAIYDVSVMYWNNAKESLRPNPALRLERVPKKDVNRWVEVFFDAFNYPKSLIAYITQMVIVQIEHGIEFYVGKVSDKDVSCFCVYNDGQIMGIYGVGTKTRYQRRGYATAMLSNYINNLIQEDKKASFCLQVQKNTGAERLYKKIGFKTIYVQKRFDWNPLLIR